jgi:hypothetical protein
MRFLIAAMAIVLLTVTCVYRKSDSAISVMKAAKDGA